jgi:NAD(P)-dependent dehydrogenase (short-subunit alcohol dehydrogenase family)
MKKYVIISGGLGVLGQSYAEALKDDGFDILLLDTKVFPETETICGEYFQCDITDEKDMERLEKYLSSEGCEIHGLINNASCQPEGFTSELEDYLPETFRRVLEVNLVGSFLLVKLVVPFMKKQGFGSIVNIGSIQGVVAPTFSIYEGMSITSPLVYAVSKAGIIHFCKWVAAKYGRYGIRCNAVSPGGVGDSQRGGSDFAKTYASRVPLGRMASSSDAAEAVRFLISDRSGYITGQNLLVDGGWTIY